MPIVTPISELPVAGPLSGNETIPLVQNNGTKQYAFQFDPTLNYVGRTFLRRLADEFWNVCDYPWLATGNGGSDDTAAVQACINAAAANGRGVFFPPRVRFQVNSLNIPSNSHLRGGGIDKTILTQISGALDLMHFADPGDGNPATTNIKIESMTLAGTVTTDGFYEVIPIVYTQGVDDVTIQHVKFIGWRGDAIYIGTGNTRGQNPTQVRHNTNIRILDCVFNGQSNGGATNVGVNNFPLANRNAISVIDCGGLWVERCFFINCSQPSQPGCIDIEPDSGGSPAGSSAVIRNINIIRNRFRNNYGSAVIAVNLPNAIGSYLTPPDGIQIIGNEIDNGDIFAAATQGVGISISGTGAVTRLIPELGVTLRENVVLNVYSPFLIRAVRGVDIIQNKFGKSKYSGEIGDSAGALNTLDIRFEGNELFQVASDLSLGGNAVLIYFGDYISFTNRNIFDSCGKSDNSYNSNITLTTSANKQNITVEDNLFCSPAANSNAWDVRHDAGVLVAGTTRHARNRLVNVNGGTVNFFHDYIPADDWQGLPLLNSWVAYGSNDAAPQFMKDGAGRVWLRGSIKSGTTTSGTSIANIPAGFRPGKTLEFVAYTAAGVGSVQVEFSQGDLQALTLPGNTLLSLNGISWKAEA